MDEQLKKAIQENNVAVVQVLLEEDPRRLEQRDEYGQTPLIGAVYTRYRSLDCIGTLIKAGADVNARNRWGFTPLHVVIWNEYFPPEAARSAEIIQLLLYTGAELEDDRNENGYTPLTIAVQEDCRGDARLLLSKGANPNKAFPDWTPSENYPGSCLLALAWLKPEMMQILIEGGANVNVRNSFGHTLIEEIENCAAEAFEARKQQSLKLLRQVQ